MSYRSFGNSQLVVAAATAAGIGLVVGASLSTLLNQSRQVDSNESAWDLVRIKVVSTFLNSYYTIFGMPAEKSAKAFDVNIDPQETKTSARHVAIIMDGNRRYGKSKHGDALKGHWDGGNTLVDCVKWCMELGVEVLTVYAFSTENWNRPPEEIDLLMNIFCKFASKCEEEAMLNNIKITVLSTNRNRLPADVLSAINQMEERTINNDGLKFNLAVSYGSRDDIAMACQKCVQDVNKGVLTEESITQEDVAKRLSTHDLPQLDILIRTSGERRLSNFLLFETAYAELFFIDKFWPQLTRQDLKEVFAQFDQRQRRFGR